MDDRKRPDPKDQTSTGRLPAAPVPVRPPSSRGVTLVVFHQTETYTAQLDPGRALVIGRKAPSDIVVDDDNLSRQHARFSLADGRITVEDLGSRNGTHIGGQPVQREVIDIGGEVMMANTWVRIFALGAAGDPALESEVAFRRRLIDEVDRSALRGRSFAVLAIQASAAETGRGPSASWAARLREHLRTIDRVSLYTQSIALALLPDISADEAWELAEATASASATGGAPRMVGVAVYPYAASTVDKLVDLARDAARRATPEQPVAAASTEAWTPLKKGGASDMITGDAMRDVLDLAKRTASSPYPMLIRGETGTGKELMAQFLHRRGPRPGKPMLSLNCGALTQSILGSALFGHERGSFTGAEKQHRGWFEAADGGTLFLDEIGELSPDAQAALLRVLDSGTLTRLGSTQEIPVDVRVIAATHRDLEVMVKKGTFREDLYFRLNTIVLDIPPLRLRLDELPRLTQRFLANANRANNRCVRGFSAEAMALLQAYQWPGNIRELRNVVDRAVVVAQGDHIQPTDLPQTVRAAQLAPAAENAAPARDEAQATLQNVEAALYKEALDKADGRVAKAAKQLRMSRSTLDRKLTKLGLKPENKPKKFR